MEGILYGFMGKWLRVNLTTSIIEDQKFDEHVLKKFLGISGMGAKILYDETSSDTDPLGPENVLIIGPGIMGNTQCPFGGRFHAVSKSPLSGAFGEGNSGGTFGPMIRKAGYDGIIITGRSESPVYLSVIEGVARIEDASALWGKDSYETSDVLQTTHGKKAVVACIGQGGENLVKYASIMNDGIDARSIGRLGLGAVMGSKKLKAIVCYGTQKLPIKEQEKLKDSITSYIKPLAAKIPESSFRKFGTPGAYAPYIGMGEIPIKNWQLGYMEGMEDLAPPKYNEVLDIKPYHCAQCIQGCGRSAHVREGKYASIRNGGPEYETLAFFGPNILCNDLEGLQMCNELCNRYGIDTISAGNTIAWAMEAFEYGLITKDDTDGLEIKWGDIDAVIEIIKCIAFRKGIGNLLAEGCGKASIMLGKGSDAFAVQVRNVDPPAHDPRCHVSSGVCYVTNARGACHQAGTHSSETAPMAMESVRTGENVRMGKNEYMGSWAAEVQNAMTMIDSLGACKIGNVILGPNGLSIYTEWVNYILGESYTIHNITEIGERIHNLKWLYNLRCGVTRMDMKLPIRLTTRKRGAGGCAELLPQVDLMLSDYFKQRGWSEFGVPLPETLKKLGLEDCINDISVPIGPELIIG